MKNKKPAPSSRLRLIERLFIRNGYLDSRSITQATSLLKGGVFSFNTPFESVLTTPEAIYFLPRVSHQVTLKFVDGLPSISIGYSNERILGIPREYSLYFATV